MGEFQSMGMVNSVLRIMLSTSALACRRYSVTLVTVEGKKRRAARKISD